MKQVVGMVLLCLSLVGCQGLIESEQPVVIQQGQQLEAESPTPLFGPTSETPLPTFTPTPLTPTLTPFYTATATSTPTPPPTVTPRPTATHTISPPTATATEGVEALNVLNNQFDQGFVLFNNNSQLAIATEWELFWNETQTRPVFIGIRTDSPAGTNPPYEEGGRGDMDAQKWVCASATCDAGIQQRIQIPSGVTCTFGARVTSISSQSAPNRSDVFDGLSAGSPEYQTELAGSQWFVSVNGNRTVLQNNPYFGNNVGLPDIQTVETIFTSPGGQVTLGIGNVRTTTHSHQTNYIYNARLSCSK